MFKLHLKSPAAFNRQRDAYGYGRLYYEIKAELLKRDDVVLVEDYKQADIQVCLALPHQKLKYFHWWGRFRHPVQVVYATWETTRIPIDWAEVLNTMAGVFTTSEWCVDVFKENGVTAPVYNVPHGVDIEKFPFLERDWSAKPFVYLWQGMHPNDRKGRKWIEQAFQELALPDTRLILKWYPMIAKAWGPAVYPEARKLEIGQFLEKDDYVDLMRDCHVSVNPFRGEGFGMLPLETAATGMATIATNWSGATEYLNDTCFRPLKYSLCEPGQDYISTVASTDCTTLPGQDAIPDLDDLKAAMLYFYENREAAAELGRRAHEYIKQEWSWARAADMFVKACKSILIKSYEDEFAAAKSKFENSMRSLAA